MYIPKDIYIDDFEHFFYFPANIFFYIRTKHGKSVSSLCPSYELKCLFDRPFVALKSTTVFRHLITISCLPLYKSQSPSVTGGRKKIIK